MEYSYNCDICGNEFSVNKHSSEYQDYEPCSKCLGLAGRIYKTPYVNQPMKAHYNPAFGCYVKNNNQLKDLCKKHNVVEVGNEKLDNIHKEANKIKEDRHKKSWESV